MFNISIGHSLLGVEMHHPPSVLIKHAVFAATEAIEYIHNEYN